MQGELLRMLSRANLAASNITSVVVTGISEFKPPIIPASATGFLPSLHHQIICI